MSRTVLARYTLPSRAGSVDAEVVLVNLGDENVLTPFVTWLHRLDAGEADGFFWGNYFYADQEAEAREDFFARCQRGDSTLQKRPASAVTI